MKYRDKHVIVYEILNTCREPKTKTKLLGVSGVSHTQAKDYLPLMVQNDLLRLDENIRYVATDKGMQFIALFEELRSITGKWLFEAMPTSKPTGENTNANNA